MKTLGASFSRVKQSVKRGFTLIEILVATAVMIILIGMVIQITSNVLGVWNDASGKLAANAEARIAMDLITSDLETAVFRNNGQQWLRVDGPVDVEGNLYDSQTVALKLFAPALDRPTTDDAGVEVAGDICAIAYRLEYKEAYEGSEFNVYALYRDIENPRDTFNNLLGSLSEGTDSAQLELTESKDPFWSTDSITAEENYLAANVVDFKVIVYEDDGTFDPEPVNADEDTFEIDDDYAFGGSDGSTAQLLYVDVILTIITDEGMAILQAIDEGRATEYSGANAAEDVVREKGQTFTRRIYFASTAL
ncbi:MAG: prepilin-type N-terminal cleavage/methylation domain-containing protein [Verrucomicrobiota bacterium]